MSKGVHGKNEKIFTEVILLQNYFQLSRSSALKTLILLHAYTLTHSFTLPLTHPHTLTHIQSVTNTSHAQWSSCCCSNVPLKEGSEHLFAIAVLQDVKPEFEYKTSAKKLFIDLKDAIAEGLIIISTSMILQVCLVAWEPWLIHL